MGKRAILELSTQVKEELIQITRTRTEAAAKVQRAKIILLYSDGKRISQIVQQLNTNRPLIERVINKASTFGPMQALKDLPRPGRPPIITDDAKNWVLSIACQKPKDFGYAYEIWTYSLLIKHIRKYCEQQGHICLKALGKGRLHAILSKSNIKPHKISYYLERRDPEFDQKMTNVLCVYKEVQILNTSGGDRTSVIVSYDEKSGIQAIKNIAAELSPVPGKYPTVGRDYEYKRLGTVSLLAGIDLHTGRVISLVRDRHRSREFIEFFNKLDENYPKEWKIGSA